MMSSFLLDGSDFKMLQLTVSGITRDLGWGGGGNKTGGGGQV